MRTFLLLGTFLLLSSSAQVQAKPDAPAIKRPPLTLEPVRANEQEVVIRFIRKTGKIPLIAEIYTSDGRQWLGADINKTAAADTSKSTAQEAWLKLRLIVGNSYQIKCDGLIQEKGLLVEKNTYRYRYICH